jgi:CHASE3 domain sensor protein
MKLNIRSKLIGGFLIVLALLVLAGGVSIVRLGQVDASVKNLADNLAKDQFLADEMVSQILLVRFYANKYIRGNERADLERYEEEVAKFDEVQSQARAAPQANRGIGSNSPKSLGIAPF